MASTSSSFNNKSIEDEDDDNSTSSNSSSLDNNKTNNNYTNNYYMKTVRQNKVNELLNNNGSNNISLQQYYYGERVPNSASGEDGNGKPRKKRRLNRYNANSEMDVHIKCTACPKVFKKNAEIVPHIFEHLERDEQSGKWTVAYRCQPLRHSNLRCHICMKKTSMESISIHVKNSHEMKNHEESCRICELYYKTKKDLVKHMQLTHPCMDMPYSCDICGFQSSFRVSVFKHFEENHQKNYVMCPFCMLIVPVETVPDMKVLQDHLIEHVSSSARNIRCLRCALRFTCVSDLQDHLIQKHQRHPDNYKIEEVKIYKLNKGEEPILMSRPKTVDPRYNFLRSRYTANNTSNSSNSTTTANTSSSTSSSRNHLNHSSHPGPSSSLSQPNKVIIPNIKPKKEEEGAKKVVKTDDDGLEIVYEHLVEQSSTSDKQKSVNNQQNSGSSTNHLEDNNAGRKVIRKHAPQHPSLSKLSFTQFFDSLGLRRVTDLTKSPNI